MKVIKIKTEVVMNIRDEYRIVINGEVPAHQQFDTIKQMKKYAKENDFVKTYNRLDHRNSCSFYNQEIFSKVILITEGEFVGSFACVNDMGGLMSRLDNSAKRNAWTMTRGNKGNNVEGHSDFDKTRWVINKNYESFTKQSIEGKGSLNHFKQSKKLHGDSWKFRLAQFMATLSDAELAEVERERVVISNRTVTIEEQNIEPVIEVAPTIVTKTDDQIAFVEVKHDEIKVLANQSDAEQEEPAMNMMDAIEEAHQEPQEPAKSREVMQAIGAWLEDYADAAEGAQARLREAIENIDFTGMDDRDEAFGAIASENTRLSIARMPKPKKLHRDNWHDEAA
ncbi:hypothetical protein CJP16_09500 [Aeromonas sobria]|uniref:Uncharacterized protein n=1 Tax=Aeromonas sobria TaxID=646 RepID=A0A2N3J0L5_AERSO|nr:hypothetical protein [Aeromonas sobria]PKQ78978.1 hypothetical protein CJP16_09500 [Aeromonas sobria]